MKREQLMYGKAAEEATEVVEEGLLILSRLNKLALKTQQFGANEICPGQPLSNVERMHEELDDLTAVIEVLNDKYGFGYQPNRARVAEKKERMSGYADYSVSLGLVDPE